MRKPRLYTRTWRQIDVLRREQFTNLLATKGDAFDDKFFDMVRQRRGEVAKIALKLLAIQLPILTFLIFALIPIQANISLLGISPSANRNLREILLVVSALLGLGITWTNLHHQHLSEMLSVLVARKSKGDKNVRSFLGVGYGTDFFVLPEAPSSKVSFGWGYLAFLGVLIALLVAVILTAIIATMLIHIFLLRDIYLDPSYSRTVSIWTIIFVFITDLLSASALIIQSGFLLMRNHENMSKLSEMSEEKARAVYRTMAESHYRKPWLLRLFVRPKIPRKLD